MRPLILIVDDTPLARQTLRRTLEGHGYHVIEADSAEDAIRVYAEEWPDLVTMDMLMDRHNGIAAIRALRQLDHKAKIIVCSATSDQSFVAGAAGLGVESYLNKPVATERLIAAVEKALA